MQYTAFMVDIVNSKKLSLNEREQTQIFIKACLSVLNNIFKPSLEFEVIFSAGDEVQGLFKTPTAAFLYLRLLKMILSPLQIRCGIGVGGWDVRIPSGTSSEQDGSAYHNARAAITNSHDKNDYSVLLISDNENDLYINTLINTSLLFIKKQSNYQTQILLLTELLFPLFDTNAMDLQDFKQLFTLLHARLEDSVNILNEVPTDFEPFHVFVPSVLESKVGFTSMLKKGLSTKISNILKTSRQNIDKVIKAGNIAEIRNIDVNVLLLIYKSFAG